MSLRDLKGIRFIKGPGYKKYTAVLPNGKKVSFGDKRYQHYKDNVPTSLGGGLYASKNHNDKKRRDSYRARHGALRCKDQSLCKDQKYSPAWFSYYFLW